MEPIYFAQRNFGTKYDFYSLMKMEMIYFIQANFEHMNL